MQRIGSETVNKNHEAPVTHTQRAIIKALAANGGAVPAWNEARLLRLRGALDTPALLAALGELVRQHDALRSTVHGGVMRSVDAADLAFQVDLMELSQPKGRPRGSLTEATARLAHAAPDGDGVGRFRATLIRLATDDHALLVVAHGVMCDGWSIASLIEELAAGYRARVRSGQCPTGRSGTQLCAVRSRPTLARRDRAAHRRLGLLATYLRRRHADAGIRPTDRAAHSAVLRRSTMSCRSTRPAPRA